MLSGLWEVPVDAIHHRRPQDSHAALARNPIHPASICRARFKIPKHKTPSASSLFASVLRDSIPRFGSTHLLTRRHASWPKSKKTPPQFACSNDRPLRQAEHLRFRDEAGLDQRNFPSTRPEPLRQYFYVACCGGLENDYTAATAEAPKQELKDFREKWDKSCASIEVIWGAALGTNYSVPGIRAGNPQGDRRRIAQHVLA